MSVPTSIAVPAGVHRAFVQDLVASLYAAKDQNDMQPVQDVLDAYLEQFGPVEPQGEDA